MKKLNIHIKLMNLIEMIFDLSYLFTIFIIAALLYKTTEIGSLRWQYALMAFILGVGDASHLIPRVCVIVDRKEQNHTISLGIGKFITSITMTLFYLFLWEIGKSYYTFNTHRYLSMIVYGFALLRILLCILPQNSWTDKNPSQKWSIIRNIPFLILGMIVMTLYMVGALKSGGSLSFLWLAILISFACYLPVVLFSHKYPKVGMLMIPKSCAYVAIVLMGFSLT